MCTPIICTKQCCHLYCIKVLAACLLELQARPKLHNKRYSKSSQAAIFRDFDLKINTLQWKKVRQDLQTVSEQYLYRFWRRCQKYEKHLMDLLQIGQCRWRHQKLIFTSKLCGKYFGVISLR